MTKQTISALRQRIHDNRLIRARLENIIMQHRHMVAGSLIRRELGPTKTEAYYLSIPTRANSWHMYVRRDELERYREKAKAWREYIHSIAEWVRINKKIEQDLRNIGKGRCEKIKIRRKKQ